MSLTRNASKSGSILPQPQRFFVVGLDLHHLELADLHPVEGLGWDINLFRNRHQAILSEALKLGFEDIRGRCYPNCFALLGRFPGKLVESECFSENDGHILPR